MLPRQILLTAFALLAISSQAVKLDGGQNDCFAPDGSLMTNCEDKKSTDQSTGPPPGPPGPF